MRRVLGDCWEFVKHKIPHPMKAFTELSDRCKPLTHLVEEGFHTTLTDEIPNS